MHGFIYELFNVNIGFTAYIEAQNFVNLVSIIKIKILTAIFYFI